MTNGPEKTGDFDIAAEREAVWSAFRAFVGGMVEPAAREEGLALVADGMVGIGMGEQGVYFDKGEYTRILNAITKETRDLKYAIEYGRRAVEVYPPGAASVLSEVTVTTDIEASAAVSRVVQMATFVRLDGGWMVTSASCAPLSMSPESIHALPLKFAENTMAQLKSELQAEAVELLDASIPGGMISFYNASDYPVAFINERMLEYLGYSRTEFDARFGRKFRNLVHPEDRGMLRYVIDESLARGDEYEVRHRVLRKNADAAWVIQRGRRTKEESEHGLLMSVFTDVTEIISLQDDLVTKANELEQSLAVQKRQEKKLQAAVEAAKEASRAKTVFLATMSHEIRTPMNGVIGFAELALGDPGLTTRSRDYIMKIQQSAAGLLGVINDILDISKVESGRMEVERIPFLLKDVLAQCESLTAVRAREKGVRFVVESELADSPLVLGDPTKLRQVLVNLLSNAVKFTTEGSVTLRAKVTDLPDDVVKARFEVVDTGIGMTETELRRIFLPFVQADNTTTRRYGGTGLGLTICKSYVEMMGGVLSVTSCPGAGSRFFFDVKFDRSFGARDCRRQSETRTFRDSRPVFSARVLVCEDNDINREVISAHLIDCGLSPELAVNGRVGVDMARERLRRGEPYDLVLMDIYMPEMDGLDAMDELTRIGSAAPVVAMTANVMESDQLLYREHGMADCLGKPFVAEELWSCLLKHLKPVKWLPNRRRGADEAGCSGRDGGGESPPVDKAAALRLLDQVGVRLRSGDVQVLDDLDRIRRVFSGDSGAGAKLVEQIQAYDFEDAVETLGVLRREIEKEGRGE